jgi:hypothetical protein
MPDEFESPDYWCEVCVEHAEDDEHAAELVLECQLDHRRNFDEWLDHIQAGHELPAPVICRFGDGLHIFDGYHRIGAARAAGIQRVRCHLLLDED